MNIIQQLGLRLVGKALWDLHPELRYREHLTEGTDAATLLDATITSPTVYYTTNTWVHKAVKCIADAICGLTLEVLNQDGDAQETHPVAMMLTRVNGSYSAADLWRAWVVDLMLNGEHGIEVVRDGRNGLAELWNRTGKNVDIRIEKNARYGGLVGYRIRDKVGEYELKPEQLIWSRFYNPDNAWRGLAPLAAVRRGIQIDDQAQRWSLSFFQNSARADYVIVAPQALTRGEREELKAQINEQHRGIGHAHEPLVLEAGDVKPISYPPKDIEWLAQRQNAREEIGAVFGVPDEIMGWGRDTYENFKQAELVFWRLALIPLLQQRDVLLTQWFQRSGDLKPDLSIATDLTDVQALQPDRGLLIEQANKLWTMGVPFQEINELLQLGLPDDLPGADQGYLPLSLIPAGEPRPEPQPFTPPPAEPAPEETPPEEEPPAELPPPEKAITKALTIRDYGSDVHKATWLLFKRGTEGRERGMVRLVRRLFQNEHDEVLPAVRAGGHSVYNAETWHKRWAKQLKEFYVDNVRGGYEHGADQVKCATGMMHKQTISWDLVLPGIAEYIAKMLWDFTGEVTEATQAAILALLQKASKEGWSVTQAAEAMQTLYDGFTAARSETIVRTEMIKAYNFGALEGYKAEGADGKGWLSALDDRTRQPPESEFDHAAAHGEEVGLDEPFKRTGEHLQFPGDPDGDPGNIINCRCSVYPVIRV